MIPGAPALVAEAPAVARYEELRRDVLTGVPGGGHYGAIVLVREGLAAWLAHAPACPAVVRPAETPHGRAAVPLVSDEVHHGLVRMLATMALANRVEYRP